jgi:uncharacterized membrane protein
MDKKQVLSLIQEKLRDGTISTEDLRMAGLPTDSSGESSASHVTNIFYIIGAIIAVIGVIILVAQNWDDIGFLGRLVVTAGIALVTYISALFMLAPSKRILSQVFFVISAALAPIGVAVMIKQAGLTLSPSVHAVMGLILGVLYLCAFWQTRRNVLVLVSIMYLTWSYYATLAALFDVFAGMGKWATIVLGVSYMLVAYYYHLYRQVSGAGERFEKSAIESLLYGIGTIAVLFPAIFLGGAFDLIALGLIFGVFYLSVFVKSKTMLLASGLFLMVYIIRITSEYFAESISWSLALIIIGFLVIAVGYGTYYINRKFMSSKQ